MSAWVEVLLFLVMLTGAVGTLLPVVPGLPLIGLAGLVWVLADGGGATRWTVFAVMTALMVVGLVSAYVLPGRAVGRSEVPVVAILAAVVAGVAGFFLVPVVGLPLGFALGLYLGILLRTRDARASWRTTVAAVKAYGVGVLVSVVAAAGMIAAWFAGLALT